MSSAPERRTSDTGYGEAYWQSLDGGAGYTDSVMWADIGHIIHELVGVDRQAGQDNALVTRVLDVGCAHGYLLRHLRQRGYDVRGVDFSRYALDRAPDDIQHYLSWFDLTGDEHLTNWYHPFDVVTCFETLEHIPFDQAEVAVRHLWEAVKPEGCLIATVCVVGQPDTLSDPTHVSVVPREMWSALFSTVGFEADQEAERQLRWFWLFSQHRGVFFLRRPHLSGTDSGTGITRV